MQRDSGRATTIGVVIRTLNEAALIGTCLETLNRQRAGVDLDVLVVDSGSTDRTTAIAESHGARVVSIPPEEFDYSKSLNLGIHEARGELVVMLSAHAVPVDDDWLARMVAPFDDPRVAGVASRQVPWEGAPWREVQRLARTFGDTTTLYPPERAEGIVFSNAASCIRKSVWREEPFTAPAAEDIEWAGRVAAAGWTLVYVGEAAVYHSHDETPRAQARRLIDVTRVCSGRRTLRRTLHEAAGLLYRDSRTILGLGEPPRRKLGYLAELARVAWHYVADFSQAGTTAERRRRDA